MENDKLETLANLNEHPQGFWYIKLANEIESIFKIGPVTDLFPRQDLSSPYFWIPVIWRNSD